MRRKWAVLGIAAWVLVVPAASPASLLAPAGLGKAGSDPAQVGQWEPVFDGQEPAVNAVLLRNGNVLYWSGGDAHASNSIPVLVDSFAPGRARVLDLSGPGPVIRIPTPEDGGAADMLCSAQTVLRDGRVLVVGGQRIVPLLPPTPEGFHFYGSDSARIFDPATETFTLVQPMVGWRWYPTILNLPDGTPLVASGILDVIDPTTQDPTLETYDVANDQWTLLPDTANNLLPLYPRLFVVPSGPAKGDVHYIPVGCLWCLGGAHPLQGLWNLHQTLDLDTMTWTKHGPALTGVRQDGAAQLLPLRPPAYRAEVLTLGGSLGLTGAATQLAEITDLSVVPPEPRLTGAMHHPRWNPNAVALPTGEMLVIGGGLIDNVLLYGAHNIGVLEAEMYDAGAVDPITGIQGVWREVAAMEVPRMYHSTAMLLPDGRVLVGGHVPLPTIQAVDPQIYERRMEIYDPPYLFRGARPTIAAAPASVGYGATFTVTTPEAATIASAVLVRPASATHAFDMDGRVVELAIGARGDGTLDLRAPPDGTIAPPGPWMLFLNAKTPEGPVPSVAKFVQLG